MNAPKADLEQAKRIAVDELLARDKPPGNVVGVGIGKKHTNGSPTPIDCIRVYVVTKLTDNAVRPNELVRPSFGGVPSDVIEIKRLGRRGEKPTPVADKEPGPGSPIRIKTDAPNVNSGAIGTLGMVVADTDQRYILGCNHSIAANGRALEHPGAAIDWAKFVGNNETIATPYVCVRLVPNGDNPVDCALAKIKDPTRVQPAFPAAFGRLNSPDPIPPRREMRVKKIGAATNIREGTIVDFNVDLYVDYSFGRFRFADQILIDAGKDNPDFATAGDSGAIVVETETNHAVGMIFAASGRFAVACRLERVLAKLQDEIQRDREANPGSGKGGSVDLRLVTS